MTPSCAQARLVDSHFALRIDADAERDLRLHLQGCGACRDRYQRQLLLARLDPRAPTREERLGRGLGLWSRRDPRRWLALAGAVAAAAMFVLWPTRTGDGFTARGGPAALPSFVVYRVSGNGPAQRVIDSIDASDELAFAYRNPHGRRFLLVFGVDEHGHVYWYHPGWTDAAEDPGAVPVRPAADAIELPEAIAHPLDGTRLVLHALLFDAPVHVREIEQRLARGEVAVPGAEEQTLALEVRR